MTVKKTTTTETVVKVTDRDIETLRDAAAAAGKTDEAALCEKALAGDAKARKHVETLIAKAAAHQLPEQKNGAAPAADEEVPVGTGNA